MDSTQNETQPTCAGCGCEMDQIYRHHVVPRVKGGKKGEVVECCWTCSRQVHMLFTEGELARMSWEELLQTEAMQKYLTWKRRHPGERFRTKLSRRLKRRR